MPLVLDASICACWLLPDELDPAANLAFDLLTKDHATVPMIWWYEMRNILMSNERRKRITSDFVDTCLSALAEFTIYIDQSFAQTDVMKLARQHRLTVYDAAYLELAVRMSAPLATLDRALSSAAKAEGVTLIGE